MIIQHNIPALNSYRNYNNNVSALAKNLEKLSSGYRINSAGDDAAGLAISEKMRAQITGLDAAQKNVKDGTNLVKTAEGALQEVQDMMNRMVYLATQSANGTYDNEVDRMNLQKEVDALKAEIDRIADSANFNGQKLLDGTLATTKGGLTNVKLKGMDRILTDTLGIGEDAYTVVGEKTIFDSYSDTAAKGVFKVDLSGLTFKAPASAAGVNSAATKQTLSDFSITIGDLTVDLSTLAASKAKATWSRSASGVVTQTNLTAANLASDIVTVIKGTNTAAEATINGVTWTVAVDGNALKFTQKNDPTSQAETKLDFDVEVNIDESGVINGNHPGGTLVDTLSVYAGQANRANTIFEITADDIRDGAKITLGSKTFTLAVGPESKYTGTNVVNLKDLDPDNITTEALDVALTEIAKAFGGSTNMTGKDATGTELTNVTFTVTVSDSSTGHPTGLAIMRTAAATSADNVVFDTLEELAQNFSMKYTVMEEASDGLTLQIGDTSDDYNKLSVSVQDMHADSLGIGDVDISTQEGAAAAIDKIKNAINTVSSTRGDLGALQNRLDHTANNLSIMEENITNAESNIRDTDIAEEMMAYTKNNILVQSAQAMLAQANMLPQGVLQLLG